MTAAGEHPSAAEHAAKVPEAETVMFARPAAIPVVLPGAPDGGRNGTTPLPAVPSGRHRTGPPRPRQPASRRTWVTRAALAAVCCVQAALSLRLQNTASAGEAADLTVGHQEIAHLLHGAPLPGSYPSTLGGIPALYPVLGAFADDIHGLAAARAVSLLAMLVATVLLYAMTRRLFNEQVGLYAAGLFAVAEGTVLAGNLATPDATSLCLVALACWIVVRTAPWPWPGYLLAVPVAGLAVGTYYWAVLGLPALGLLGVLATYPYTGRPAPSRLLVPAVVIAGVCGARLLATGRMYLTAAVAATVSRAPGGSQAMAILANSGKWGGLVAALAVIGTVRYAIQPAAAPGEELALPGPRARRIALGTVLTGTVAVMLADQLQLNAQTSLDTHVGFAMFFAGPMAGVGLARLVGEHYRRAQIGVLVWTAVLMLGLVQSGQVFASWPDSSAMVAELSRYLGPHDRYLVENDDIAIYYLRNNPDAQPGQFTSTSAIRYRGADGKLLTGSDGYLAALRADYFHVVIYDGTVTAALDKSLAAELKSNPGYQLAATVRLDSSGDRDTCFVWVRAASSSRTHRAPAKPAKPALRRDRSSAVTSHR